MTKDEAKRQLAAVAQDYLHCCMNADEIYDDIQVCISLLDKICVQEALRDAKPFLECISKMDKKCRNDTGEGLSTERYCSVCNIPYAVLNVESAGVLCSQCREDLKNLLDS